MIGKKQKKLMVALFLDKAIDECFFKALEDTRFKLLFTLAQLNALSQLNNIPVNLANALKQLQLSLQH